VAERRTPRKLTEVICSSIVKLTRTETVLPVVQHKEEEDTVQQNLQGPAVQSESGDGHQGISPNTTSAAPSGHRGPLARWLAWWYRLTMPKEPPGTAPIAVRERYRRSRIASAILLIYLIILVAALPLGLQDLPTLLSLLVGIGIAGIGIILNRVGQVYIVGTLLTAFFILSIVAVLVSGPNQQIDVDYLDLYYVLLIAELFAAALLPPWALFLVALVNSGITVASLSLQPAAPALTAQLDSPQVGFFTLVFPPVALHWAVAGVGFLLVRSATDAIRRADRAEEIIELQQREARAQQLDALKDQFIVSVNHELRTPIMTMQGYIELLGELQNQVDPTERTTMLNRARAANEVLVHLVQSILDTRRIDKDADAFVPEPVALRPALYAAATLTDPNQGDSPPRQLYVDVPEDLVVVGEKDRLQQVLTNLLSNAVKYSAAGTPVRVAAHVDGAMQSSGPRPKGAPKPEKAFVELTIQDYGLGIPPDQIPLLFRRFVRLPRDLASRTLGTGLGLYLCRVYVEAMGGTIWVESSGVSGEGSTFHIRLPQAPYDMAPEVSVEEPELEAAVSSPANE
jgi:signal transduction histidine kinase